MYNDVLIERNQFKQQCTQGIISTFFSRKILFEFSNLFVAIRQWDQALREKTEYKDALTKVSWLVKLRAWNTWKLHGFFSCYTLFETTNFYPKIQFFRTVQNIVNKNFWAKKYQKSHWFLARQFNWQFSSFFENWIFGQNLW